MADIETRIEGRAGRITFARPKALNALSHDMALAIEAALDAWRDDPAVALILIDAEGERAFCAGGDIAQMYAAGMAGDYDGPRRFWRDEYRMNAKIAEYPKPIVALMQGFVMGGGVGVGCNAAIRVVGETSQVAMPESGIGLVPDVGGSLLLARAPGHAGEYLALTAARMNAADAVFAGFADHFVPEAEWAALTARLVETGDADAVATAARPAPDGVLSAEAATIDRLFAGDTLADIRAALAGAEGTLAEKALKAVDRNSPLSMACGMEMLRRLRAPGTTIRDSLALEYRFTYRAIPEADFLEGVRAQIIDKDRNPRWRHAAPAEVTADEVAHMLAPLGNHELWQEETP